MLDSICSPVERNDILYQWKNDEHLLRRNTFIGDCTMNFRRKKDDFTLLKVMMANYILEGIYFYSGFMFFYNLSRNGKMPGSAQEIRYINRDENTHLWLFRNMILEMKKELPELFTPEHIEILKEMLKEGFVRKSPGALCDRESDCRTDKRNDHGIYPVSRKSAVHKSGV